MYGGDEVNAVVLDLGSYQVKAGYAGDDAPKYVFPSAVGTMPADGMEVDGKKTAGRYCIGNANLAVPQDGLEIASPFTDGILTDWDAVEAIYDHAFKDQLRLDLKAHPLLFGEPSHTGRATREKQVELVFEKYDTPALFLAKNAVLSTFSTGRQTALVVDAGHDQTMISPVHDGYVLQKANTRCPMGGSLLTQCMAEVVQSAGTKIHPRFEFSREEVAPGQFEVKYEPRRRLGLDGKPRVVDVSASYRQHAILQIAQDIKEAVCRVSDAPFDPEENANIPQASYELPDGQEISVGVDRFALCECLFNTSLLERYGAAAQGLLAAAGAEAGGDGPASLQAAINDCITRCDVDARRELYANVLLTGGTAGFASLKDRLERELTEVAPALARVKVSAPVNAVERRFSVWIGGSILASLGSFQQMWMSKAEYAEYGAGLIHKKAP